MKQIQIFGDSIMKGVVYDAERKRYSLCKDRLSLEGVELINRSKMGATIRFGLDNVRNHLSSCDESTIAVLEFGGNDCNFNWAEVSAEPDRPHLCMVEPNEFRMLYTDTVHMLQETGATVVISSLPPICAPKFMDHLSSGLNYDNILHWLGDVDHLSRWQKQYSEMSEDVAAQTGCLLMPLRPVGDTSDWSSMICDDGLHPTETGYIRLHSFLRSYLAALC